MNHINIQRRTYIQRNQIKDIPTSPLLLVLNAVLGSYPRKKEITTLKKQKIFVSQASMKILREKKDSAMGGIK